MDTQIESLEKKVNQLLRIHQHTQQENSKLREQLSKTKTKNRKLTEKIQTAADKLEVLLTKIPDNKK